MRPIVLLVSFVLLNLSLKANNDSIKSRFELPITIGYAINNVPFTENNYQAPYYYLNSMRHGLKINVNPTLITKKLHTFSFRIGHFWREGNLLIQEELENNNFERAQYMNKIHIQSFGLSYGIRNFSPTNKKHFIESKIGINYRLLLNFEFYEHYWINSFETYSTLLLNQGLFIHYEFEYGIQLKDNLDFIAGFNFETQNIQLLYHVIPRGLFEFHVGLNCKF